VPQTIIANVISVFAAAAPKSGLCPYPGRYAVNGVAREGAKQNKRTGAAASNARDAACNDDLDSLAIGCRDSKNLEFHSACGSESVSGNFNKYTSSLEMQICISTNKIFNQRKI
jgi:hypothetical protein